MAVLRDEQNSENQRRGSMSHRLIRPSLQAEPVPFSITTDQRTNPSQILQSSSYNRSSIADNFSQNTFGGGDPMYSKVE